MTQLRGIRDLSAAAVRERFQLPYRWMNRIGAWRARNIDITSPALEAALSCPELEERLLAPEALPRAGATLDPSWVTAAVPGAAELVLVSDADGCQLIAQAEESLAAEGWGAATPTDAPAQAPGQALPGSRVAVTGADASVSPSSQLLAAEAAVQLFSPDQVAALKLEILTGTDDDARRAAVRRISLSDLATREKGLLYLVALQEGGDSLRSEAATQLGVLGMRPELVRAFRTYAGGNAEARRLSLERIGSLGENVGDWEETVATSVLVTLLRQAEPDLRVHVLGALGGYARRLAEDEAMLGALLESLVPVLVSASDQLATPGATLVGKLVGAVRGNGATVVEAILAEAASLGDDRGQRRARSLLHVGVCAGSLEREQAAVVADALIDDIQHWETLSPGLAQLESALVSLDELALEALDDHLVRGEAGLRAELVGLLERLVSKRDDPEFTDRAVGVLAANLEGAPTILASRMRQSQLLRRSDLGEGLRAQLARTIIAGAHLESDALLRDEVVEVFRNLGGAAIVPLIDALRQVRRAQDRVVYLQAMARAAIGAPAPDVEPVRRALRELTALFHEVEDPGPDAILAIAVAGRLTMHPGLETEELNDLFEVLRAGLWRGQLTAGAIEALGHAVVAPAADLSERLSTVDLLLRLVTARLPAAQGRMREDEDGVVYDLDDTETYTTRLPALLSALERAATSTILPAALRARVAETLHERWLVVIDFKIIWGPGNVSHLAECLQRIASSPGIPNSLRRRLLTALRQRVENLHVAGLLALAAGELGEERELDDFFTLVATDLIQLSRDEEMSRSLEDREQILSGIARLVPRSGLVDSEGRSVREELLATLYAGLRDRVPGVLGRLRRLRDDPVIDADMRETIGRRLQHAGKA